MNVGRIIGRLKRRYESLVYQPHRLLQRYVTPTADKLIRLGSVYGGWTVAETTELRTGVAVLCGAGEDISFDIGLQSQFGCDILIVDPTPRAIEHFAGLQAAHAQNRRFAINNGNDFYDFGKADFRKIKFMPVAIWCRRETLKFWLPLDERHVSHSLTNLQGSQEYVEVNADTLPAILLDNGYRIGDLSLLKMDVEGAETTIIDFLCDHEIFPTQLLVEFDEVHFPSAIANAKIEKAIIRLLERGYKLIHYDGVSNCLFLRSLRR